MATRTINIAVIQQTPKPVTIKFVPDLTALGDDTLLTGQEYIVTTAADGTGSIDLPVSVTGSVIYTYFIPRADGKYSTGSFELTPGSAINLEDLLALGPPVEHDTITYNGRPILYP